MSETRVDVVTSAIWRMTSTVIRSSRSCLVVDPGFFPREIVDLGRLISREECVEALFFTHGHWDHVVGHGIFPGVPVYASSVLARSVAEGGGLATKAMAKVREFDSRWYVERPWGYGWPNDLRGLDDGGRFSIGDLEIEAFLVPGHTSDGMAIRAEHWLLVGDYLSPCEIPFVDNLAHYRLTLQRLQSLLAQGVETVIPGHGPPLSVEDARRIAREDLRYLDSIVRCSESNDLTAALNLPLPRAGNVAGMRGHHAENCRQAGLPVSLPGGVLPE
jgi:glyoxylase-like metal-dependent hydrolase (beta-lactamase superfamily II)